MEPILRRDGTYTLFRVEVQWKDWIKHYGEDGSWGSPGDGMFAKVPIALRSEDHHTGKYTGRELEPFQSFSASGECWQTTSIHGTFEKDKAFKMLELLRAANPDYRFRVVQHVVIQHRIPLEA